jgi:FkbM family methyltransferase
MRLLARYGVHETAGTLLGNGAILLGNLGVSFDPNQPPEPLLRAYDFAKELHDRVGARFSIQSDGAVVCTIAGIHHLVGTPEEVFILREIHLWGEYDITLGGRVLFVDVGANVGSSALYFAGTHPDAVVEAFEPAARTYQRGLANLKLNVALSTRIHYHNYGLYSEDGMARMRLNLDRPARSSMLLGDRDKQDQTEEVEVSLRDASNVMLELIDRWPDRRVVLKVDTEGAEYAILENLAASNAVQKIDVILGEWHRVDKPRNPSSLAAVLSSQGFVVVVANRNNTPVEAGMFYAFRHNGQIPKRSC